ncbi:MAG TPA: GNAT family N-acetyltransferase [Actinophytocola sp.]|nr:GNAT family N-acetyltransferase [Actinophytocola sp.]
MNGTFPDDVPTLTDDVVTLRAHRPSDVDAMVQQSVDPESVEWTQVPVPYAREDAVGYFEAIADGWRSGRRFTFALEADGVPFGGSVSLHAFEEAGVAEIAFGLHPAARGRGLCSRAVKLLLDWGFSRFEVVLWLAHVGNWASRRVAWANGFTFDGTIAQFATQRGTRHDAWFGSLRASDDRSPKYRWNVAPELTSDRLRLRPVRPSDTDRFGELAQDPRNRHFGGRVHAVRSITDGAGMVERILLTQAVGERFDWTMTEPGADVMVGHIQLFDLDGLDDTEAKLGYSVHPDSRGRGVLRSALALVVEWAFRPVAEGGLGKRRLSLTTAASNKASRYAAEQVGFEHVGTEPSAFTSGDEGFEDKAIYQRVNPNWTTSFTNPPA